MNQKLILLSFLILKDLRDRFVKAVKAKGFSFRTFYQQLLVTAIKTWLSLNEEQ